MGCGGSKIPPDTTAHNNDKKSVASGNSGKSPTSGAISQHRPEPPSPGQKSPRRGGTSPSLGQDAGEAADYDRADNGSHDLPRDSNRTPDKPSRPTSAREMSPGSSRASSRTSTRRALLDNTGRKSAGSKSNASEDGKVSPTLHESNGHCRFCDHCRQKRDGRIPSAQKLKWIVDDPGNEDLTIKMDEYDANAVAKRIIPDFGRKPGSYDYPPYLRIDEIQADDHGINYEKFPFVTRQDSHFVPLHTPFPEYNDLQRREQRPNKPYDDDLFE